MAFGVLLGDAVLPVGGGVGGSAESAKHFVGHLFVGQHILDVPVQIQLLRLCVVVGLADATAGEGFGDHARLVLVTR